MDSLYPYSILYIEDEDAIRKNYVEYLKDMFQDVYEAKDGKEGYEVYQKENPDIMIIDINLPFMNGIELLTKIRKEDQQTKAIMLTAHADVEYLLQTNSLKLTKYLVKPLRRSELKETLLLAIEELQSYRIETIKILKLADGYSWDYEFSQLKLFNDPVSLTKKEQRLLELLFSKRDKVFTYDEIYDYVWDYYTDESINYMNALKSLLKNLRKKIPREMVENIFGTGYKIRL